MYPSTSEEYEEMLSVLKQEEEKYHTCKRCGYAIDYIVNGNVCYCEEKD